MLPMRPVYSCHHLLQPASWTLSKTNNIMSMLKQQLRMNEEINRFQLLTCTLTGPCWGKFGAGHAGKTTHAVHMLLHVLLFQLLQLCQQLILIDNRKYGRLQFCTMNINIFSYKRCFKTTNYFYLIIDIAKRSRNSIADLLSPVLLLCYILHHVIYLVNVALKKEKKKRGKYLYKLNAVMHKKKCLLILHPYMSLWTFSRARAAKPMFFRTSVLVCEFSKASRWNSMVDSVPSIWTSCCSRRFFFFKARRAADAERSLNITFLHLSPFAAEIPGLGIHNINTFLPMFIFSPTRFQWKSRMSRFF